MGCFGCFGRRKTGQSAENNGLPPPRIFQDSLTSTDSAYSNIEKPPLAHGRPSAYPTAPVPSAIASLRPTANPKYSAYSGRAETDFDIYRAGSTGYGSEKPNSSGTWADSPSSTQVSSLTARTNDFKLKEEDVDDPEEQMRKRKAEEARRKAEREEQERLDFLQWM